MKRLFVAALVTIAALGATRSAQGSTLFVSQVDPFSLYGVGLGNWPTFTSDLNAAFGGAGNVTVGGALTNLGQLLTFDALLVSMRAFDFLDTLSAAEISNLQSYVATGRRVVLFGEHSNCCGTWDDSILGVFGGVGSGNDTGSFNLSPVVANSLTAGVSALRTDNDGTATGGTALFSENVVTLWAPNVLTILSLNILDDGHIAFANNATFGTNVAAWLAASSGTQGPTSAAPEPASILLLATGVIGAGLRRYRAR